MQFTRLRLTGFKSFVDPTELVISPGLTGVVGPNGCGKSNLLEALRWVMGENRASAMRGEGMEDVIFAGASTRPAKGWAEVTLSLDNSDRRAPAAFNSADQIEVVRRITREAGSVFRVLGREARARDVQTLFADASTGAHSPALVRQGQISELINARPKARRMVLEEAAGIGGLHARRQEAEQRLSATEANLTRVADLLDQLDQRLILLSRQVKQAERYRVISQDLRVAEGLLLWLRWREADQARAAAGAALTLALRGAAVAEGEARAATLAREAAQAAIPPLREEEAIASAVLQRLTLERDSLEGQAAQARQTIADLKSRAAQIVRDREREQALTRDAGETLGRLVWEAEAIARAAEGHGDRLARLGDAARAAGEALAEAEGQLDALAEAAARLAARHQSAQKRAEEARRAAPRAEAEVAAARRAVAGLAAEQAAAAARRDAAAAAQAGAQAAVAAAEAELGQAEAARAGAEAAASAARGDLARSEGSATALASELSGLDRLMARERGAGARLLDRVRAAPGWEAALGAALGDDLDAPEAATEAGAGSGWAALDPYPDTAPLPEGAEPLTPHVTAPALLARRLAHVGVVARGAGAGLQAGLAPGQRLVSRAGDLWRWDGLRAAAEDSPSAAALRLTQANRRDALAVEVAEAAAAAARAKASHDAARAGFDAAARADQAARAARRGAEEAATAAARALSRAEAEGEMLAARATAQAASLTALEAVAAAALREMAEAEAALSALPGVAGARAGVDAAKLAVEGARRTMMTARGAAEETRREGEARERRSREIVAERRTWEDRQRSAEKRVAEFDAREAEAATALAAAAGVPDEIAERRAGLTRGLEAAEARRVRAIDALTSGEAALRGAEAAERGAEKALSAAREARARAEALREAAEAQAQAAAERVEADTGQDPATLLTTLGVDPGDLPTAAACEIDAARLRRQREALGAVNLRAVEDAAEVTGERDTLAAERQDLEDAVAKLRQGIAELNREGRQRLLAAFEDVNRNFSALFRHLFGGGEANLVLVESEDPLDAGLEIMCMPPGKKLSTLSLLSGGEQTLTALSLIFAVFLAKPAPICVLDEVDAPLDDANVTRFCDLLDEMTRRTRTRFLVITHHAVTMGRMDRLFGVTMAERGVSQLVSVDLARAGQLLES